MLRTSRIHSRSTSILIFINDLANVYDSSLLVLLADDTNVFNHGHDLSSIQHCLNKELVEISKWLKVNKLSLNIKRHTLWFSQERNYKKITLYTENQRIYQAESSKFLGLYVDEKLNWIIAYFLFSRENCQRGGDNIKSKELFYQWLYRTIIQYFYCSLFDVLQSDFGKQL